MSNEEELAALIGEYADQRAKALAWRNSKAPFREVAGRTTTQAAAWIVPFLTLYGLGFDPLVSARVAALPYALILGVGWVVTLTLGMMASTVMRVERDKILVQVAKRQGTAGGPYDLAKLQRLLDAEDLT